VFRTLALYIVAAWVLMQVADVVFPALDIPEQAIRYLLLAAVVGFPVALVFAWLFNITPEGIRRTGRFDGSESDAVEPLQGRDYAILGALAVVLGLIVYGTVDRVADEPLEPAQDAQGTSRPGRGEGPPMVAVLPFTFRGAGDDAAFFAGGVHDDLLTQLSQLSGLRVISRTSVLKYQDTTLPIPDIGRELGADAILEGGVQIAGEQIRINAQLIDARSDEHLWAETFDRGLTAANIFAVQGEIARAIAGAMQATLSSSEAAELDLIPTDSMAAYRAFHEGMRELTGFRDRSAGIAAMERAISLDPRFTRAMAELVGALGITNFTETDDAEVARAEALIETIAEIAPNSVDHLQAQAFYTYYIVRDYALADRLLSAARERAPSNIRLLQIQGAVARRAGDLDALLRSAREIVKLQPSDTWMRARIFQILMMMRRYDEALVEAEGVENPDVSTRNALAMLRLSEHGDLERYRDEMWTNLDSASEQLSDFRLFLVLKDNLAANLALRDFAAAEALLQLAPEVPQVQDESDTYAPTRLYLALELYQASGNQAALTDTSERVQDFFDLDEALSGPDFEQLHAFEQLWVKTAMADREAALAELEAYSLRLEEDYAEYLGYKKWHCQGLAMVGAAAEAARCLRRAVMEPGNAMPFFDPLLPHYDGVRAAPEFQALMDDLVAEGWITPANLERLH
jgi:TolB-like protein